MSVLSDPPEVSVDLADLLRQVGLRDRVAFRKLYDHSVKHMYGVATAILRNREAADDAVQEAYAQIWLKAASFDPQRGHPLAWMGRIVRNVVIDRYRSAKIVGIRIEDVPPGLLTVETPLPSVDLQRCLLALPEGQRHAIILSYVYGLTYTEISVALGVSVGTIKSRLVRGLRRLRICLTR